MAGMTLEQLRIFLAVAEHLHFTRAAEGLYITQPAVSAAIHSLETEYRVKLFHRIGRHVEITEAGELLQSDRLLIVVGQSHPWFAREQVDLAELKNTDWVMREPGSGTQQRLEEALQNWGINLNELKVILVLNTGEMVKAIVEEAHVAAGISELMVKKELKLGLLKAIRIIDDRQNSGQELELIRPFLKIKHYQRFQTQISQTFEKMLLLNDINI
ncbi:LysR family transcriptional regulator [Planktothrix agardhii 1033]|nr:LysR family transcriptional regulator [Planktothrix agardhii 1033]